MKTTPKLSRLLPVEASISRSRRGFTLVELAFSLSFITVLFITLLALIIYITGIYQKGLVIHSVNANGRELIDDFTRSVNAAPAKSVELICQYRFDSDSPAYKNCVENKARKFYSAVKTANVQITPNKNSTVPIHGAICTGRYSYVWNSGYALNGNDGAERAQVGGLSDFHLLKIRDDELEICSSQIDDSYNYINGNDYTPPGGTSDAYELLPRSEDNLALYDLQLFGPVQHANTAYSFESFTFILGTIAGGIDIASTGEFCTDTPDNLSTDYNYCAINKFNFATYSNGEVTTEEKNNENHRVNLRRIE